MIVRLKVLQNHLKICKKENFNSMIVRLKADSPNIGSRLFPNFNSMIVRLKDGITGIMDAALAFQFYDSPIKSPIHITFYIRPIKFQFYDSPIKSAQP